MLFDELGLCVFFKISGGKGMYLLVLLECWYGWDEVKDFVQVIFQYLVCLMLECFLVVFGLCNWVGKIFVDYLCNSCGVSIVVVYLVCVCEGLLVLVLVFCEEFDLLQGVN